MEYLSFAQKWNLTNDCLDQLKKCINVNFTVKIFHRKNTINKHEKMNKHLVDVNTAFVRNPKDTHDVVNVETFFVWDFIETYSMDMSKVSGLSGTVQVPSSRSELSAFEFFGTNKVSHTTEKAIRLVSNPPRLRMDPLSSNRVNFNKYTFDSCWQYTVDFEIGNESSVSFPFPSAQGDCPSHHSQRLSINVMDFFKENANFVDSINYSDVDDIKIVHSNGKYILKGFPLIEKLSTAEIDTVISDKDNL